jgi:hypothetical protein
MKLWKAALIALPVLSISWCTIHDDRLEAHFKEVSPGMSTDQVIGIMGKPSWVDRCGAKMPAGLPKQCTKEIGYAVMLAPLDPSYYLIWFGPNGRVSETAPPGLAPRSVGAWIADQLP